MFKHENLDASMRVPAYLRCMQCRHLLTVFKLSQVVWSAREAAVAAARTLHSQQDQARADQYQQFVNREDASVRRGKIGLALTTAAAQGAQRSLPSAEAATVGGASNAALSKVFMKLSDHMDEKTAAFLKEARRGSPAVAQVGWVAAVADTPCIA